MNLFFKIFLWFLAAISLMVGVVVFLNWTVQTEPVVSRWRISVRNQTNIYSATVAQIYATLGEAGVDDFLERIRQSESIEKVAIVDENGKPWLSDEADVAGYDDLAANALTSDNVDIEMVQPEMALSTKQFSLPDGRRYVMLISWERPRATAFFGDSPVKYLRYGILLLTALLLCWALARYLASPIGKLRRATQKLAAGDLTTRVADQVGNRRDELATLAKDFDVMAERIESLVTSQKRLSRDVSHELRSPLARMNVALEIAKQKMNGDATPVLERIEAESRRLNDMITRLLTLSKLETGSQDFESRELNFKKLVEQVAADADFEAHGKDKSVKIVQADECRIMGSESLMQSAVENVLRNAVRYTRKGTAVEVSMSNGSGDAVLRVKDHGGGVPEHELGKLFEPFYRVGEARDRGSGGTGLGLAIAEQAVRLHKGAISAVNTGDGLEVKITLPCRPR